MILLIAKRFYMNNWFPARWVLGLAAFMMLLADASGAAANVWAPLAKDDLHDPKGPAVTLLQEPSEGLGALPRDKVGNMVDWVQAVSKGVISPLRVQNPSMGNLPPMQEPEIMMDKKGSMNMVLFPHKVHTMWLECSNCHPAIFETKVGASNIRMEKILNGEQCGLCHGAVAFPPTDCNRCHSVKHGSQNAKPAGKAARP